MEIHARLHLVVMLICAKTEVFARSMWTNTNVCVRQVTTGNIVRKGPVMKTLPILMVHLPTLMVYVTHMAHVRIYQH